MLFRHFRTRTSHAGNENGYLASHIEHAWCCNGEQYTVNTLYLLHWGNTSMGGCELEIYLFIFCLIMQVV